MSPITLKRTISLSHKSSVNGKLISETNKDSVHISFTGNSVKGNVGGSIEANSIEVGGNVQGDIDANSVKIKGRHTGSINV